MTTCMVSRRRTGRCGSGNQGTVTISSRRAGSRETEGGRNVPRFSLPRRKRGGQGAKGFVGGAGNVRVAVRAERANFGLEVRRTHVGKEREDHGKVFSPRESLPEKRLRVPAGLREEYSGDGSHILIRRS